MVGSDASPSGPHRSVCLGGADWPGAYPVHFSLGLAASPPPLCLIVLIKCKAVAFIVSFLNVYNIL